MPCNEEKSSFISSVGHLTLADRHEPSLYIRTDTLGLYSPSYASIHSLTEPIQQTHRSYRQDPKCNTAFSPLSLQSRLLTLI